MSDEFMVKIEDKTNAQKPGSQSPEPKHEPRPVKTLSKKHLFVIGGALLVAIVLFGGYVMFAGSKAPAAQTAEEADRIVEKVGRLIALPENETPTLATVTDPEQLKGQPFFLNAKPGFQVLLYPIAQKAFLYDPERDIIVEVATLNLGQ